MVVDLVPGAKVVGPWHSPSPFVGRKNTTYSPCRTWGVKNATDPTFYGNQKRPLNKSLNCSFRTKTCDLTDSLKFSHWLSEVNPASQPPFFQTVLPFE